MDPTSRMFAMGAAGAAVAIPDIGGFFEGGFVAGYISDTADGVATRVLIVAPKASGEDSSIQYKTSASSDTNPPSQNEVYGKVATDFFAGSGVHPAFAYAAGLNINGFSDWYIPAKNELEIIYRNLKPTTGSNNTSSGANSNAVPSATGNYTAGDPAQTTVTAFQTGNSEAFASDYYWSSSENSSDTNNAWIQSPNNGVQLGTGAKNDTSPYARAIRSVSIIPSPDLGEAYEGGFFAGQIDDGGIIYNLVVAPKSTGENSSKQYKTTNSADSPSATAQNLVYGKLATDAFNDSAHPAFQWAKGLSIGGETDWYIPAKNELEIIYRNLKPTTTSNGTSSGANPNAVPSPTANYLAGNPAQTAITAFQTGNSEAFASDDYRSSSELSALTTAAWRQDFGNGGQATPLKSNSTYVRAIRRVPAV